MTTIRVRTALIVVLIGAVLAHGPTGLHAQLQVVQLPARDPGAQPQTGTSAIAGTVMTTDNPSQAVRHAAVTISGGGLRTQRQTVTDTSGRFAITDLPAGSFTLSTSKPSYVQSSYGQKPPGQPGTPGTPIVLAAGQRVVVDVKMPRGAVLTGTVFDQYGRPKTQIRVQALQYRTQGGQRRLQQTGNGGSATNDRGVYRIYGLSPGDYLIVAAPQDSQDIREVTADEVRFAQQPPRSMPSDAGPPAPAAGQTVGFSPVYFPGVADLASATTVTLATGEERAGLDFQLQPVPTAHVEGMILDPDGHPPQQPQLSMFPEDRLTTPVPQLGLPSEYGRVDQASGKFTFTGVTPGRYTLFARSNLRPNLPPPPQIDQAALVAAARAAGQPPPPPLPPPPPPIVLWAMAQVDVGGRDITNLTLSLQPGLSVSGRVVFEHTTLTPPADLARVRMNLYPADLNPNPLAGGGPSAAATSDGTFTLTGATPGRYRVSASAPPAAGPQGGPWVLKSVMSGGRETLDAGLDITGTDVSGVTVTFTDRQTDLSGTLLDAAGAPTKDLSVLLFSTDRTFWTPQSRRSRVIRPSPEGKFRFATWPPGEYYLVAVTDGDQIDLTDRMGLEQIAAAAIKITIAEGERKVQDLKVAK